MTGTVFSVSLGPGEPELITLKALNVLKSADVIYCPGTALATGDGIGDGRGEVTRTGYLAGFAGGRG